jgi:hypothetical protein
MVGITVSAFSAATLEFSTIAFKSAESIGTLSKPGNTLLYDMLVENVVESVGVN